MKNFYYARRGRTSTFSKLLFLSLFGIFSWTNSFAQTYATVPFYDGFETGALGTSWTTFSSIATGGNSVIQTGTLTWSTQTANSKTGNYFLGMHYPTGGTYNTNQCDLHLNLAGESNLRLRFSWAEWNDESEIQDGVFISDDNGLNFVKVLDLPGANYADLIYTDFSMSLDSINLVHGLVFSSQYIVRFQQYDNFYFAGGNDGHLYDDISVLHECSTISSITPSECSSYTAPDGATYTTDGFYFAFIANSVACDSLILIDLLFGGNTTSSILEQTCDSYTAPDGATYSTTGVYTAVIPNASNCDSIITIDLTILQPTTSSIVAEECGSYSAPDGMSYFNSGVYTAIIPNANGCDSTITIDLTINDITSTTIVESTCSDYTAPDGMVYSTSGQYTAFLTSSAGCDSTIVIDLTVNTATSGTITESVLDTYTVPSGDETYTVSGTYMDTIPNANGCDSVITIDLTVEYTGIDELNASAVSIYPNPTSGSVQIKGIADLTGIETMNVFDSRGRLVLKLDTDAEIVDLDGVEAGTYILLIQHENGTERLPIIKK